MRSTARFQLAATWPQSWIQRENWEFETDTQETLAAYQIEDGAVLRLTSIGGGV